jgi:hypothetical protein
VTTRHSGDPGLDPAQRKLVLDVEQYGLHVVRILPEGGVPGWAYSIGLQDSYQHSEVVVFGLPGEVAHDLVNALAVRIREGERFEAGDEIGDLLKGVTCTFRTVRELWVAELMGWMRWYYGDTPVPVLQCIWPDLEQRYPWDGEFNPDWVGKQPLLFHEDADDAGVIAFLQGGA